ncbi:MAG: sugar transferase [Thermincola sp.]|jgi:exopolysaccharide biosynthesis polyprenyl glycosylphosphotransferase|nr:sugar transferase [Thermincola sp.]MDT3703437.1 sugar transferase [Thermincola sp.]
MLRRTLAHLLVLAAFAALDVLLVTIGYFNLYLIRISREFSLIFQWRKVFSYDYLSSLAYFEGYLKFYFVIVVVLVFLLQKYGLYYLGVREGALDEFFKVSKAVLYSGLVVAFLSYLFKVQLFSRFVFAAFIAVSIIVLWLWRMVKLQITLSLFQRGFLQKKLLIIGAGEVGQMVAEEIRSRPGLGYRIAGFVDDDPEKMSRTVAGVEVVSTSRDIQEAVTRTGAEEILITIPSERELTNSIISQIRRYNLQIRIVPEMFNLMTTSVEVGRLGPVPYMRIVKTPMRGMPLFVKRLFDVTVSLTGLLFVSPIFLAVVTAIKLDSPGPVIFKQKRVGKNGDLFDFYKFRSMVVNAEELRAELAAANEADGPVFKIREDPRVTRVGRFLRKYSLDELPQLLNVIKGDMSLVGPRPPLPSEVEEYGNIEWRRLEVIPGITGLWQISGRSEVSFRKWMELDVYYIENWSFWLDLKILLRTIPVVLTGKGAY